MREWWCWHRTQSDCTACAVTLGLPTSPAEPSEQHHPQPCAPMQFCELQHTEDEALWEPQENHEAVSSIILIFIF